MPNQRLTLANINQQNQQFWLEQSELLRRRIQDTTLRDIAMADLSAKAAMMVPVRSRKSLEQALSHAEKSLSIFQRNFSRKGGKAAKIDGLQGVILEIVRDTPHINTQRLLQRSAKWLRGVIQSFSKLIRSASC